MTKDPVTVSPEETIVLARAIMHQRGIRHLPVMDGDRLVGIITDRDVRQVWASGITPLSAWELHCLIEKILIWDVMSAPVITATPETPLEIAVSALQEKKIGGLPVLADGRLVGILTETDVFRAFARLLHYGNVEGDPDHPRQPVPWERRALMTLPGIPSSEEVMSKAARLAAQLRLAVKLLLILGRSEGVAESHLPGERRGPDDIIGGLLPRYWEIAKAQGVEIETAVMVGDAATITLDEIGSSQYDVVITECRMPFRATASPTEREKDRFVARLLEASPVPVFVVHESRARHDGEADTGALLAGRYLTGRKTFWCPSAGRVVEVEYAEVGPALLRRQVDVLECSAYDHPGLISCGRVCLDPAYRRAHFLEECP